MKIFVAAPWKHRLLACEAADRMAAAGHVITSRWLRGHEDTTDPVRLREEAENDWNDVYICDIVVVLHIEMSEGKAVEQGLALAMGKRLIGVGTPGEPSNLYHHLRQYVWVPTLDAAITALSHRSKA